MPTIAQLNQRHPGCDLERLADLRALYDGDELLEKRLSRFLIQREREKNERYALRKREWQYRNYLGPIIDFFASMLFTSRPILKAKRKGDTEPVTDPGKFYTGLREDCDRNGTDIDAFFKARVTDAMIEGRSWVRLQHVSDAGPEPSSLLDFEARKIGDSWLRQVNNADVYDWEVDDDGRLVWAIVHRLDARRTSIDGNRDSITETWEYLTQESVETFALTYDKKSPPAAEATVPSLGIKAHRYGAVPLLCFELPAALWVASRLNKAQTAHFRKLNAQSWSLSCTAYAMPVAKVEDADAFSKTAVGAGYGIVIGVNESWEWEAPPTAHFASLDTEIKAEKDEIFRVAHQMALGVENNAAAIGRSADSKAADIESTRVILTAFSRVTKETIERALDLMTRARGEEFIWSVEGLDDFAAVDVASLVETFGMVNDAGGIPSKTFNVAMKTRLAEALLRDADESTKATIRDEIEDNEPDPADMPTEEEKLHAMAAGLTGDPANGSKKPFGGRKPGGKESPFPPGRGNGSARPPPPPPK